MPRTPTAGEMLDQHIRRTASPSTTFEDVARAIGGVLGFVGTILVLVALAYVGGA